MDSKEVKKLDKKLIELKKQYDKIRVEDYPKALDFWEDNIIPVFANHPIPFLINNLPLNIALDNRPTPKSKAEAAMNSFFKPESEKDILTALPREGNVDEREIFNLWYLKTYSKQSADIEKAKQIIQNILSNSPDGMAFLLKEKNDLEKELNALDVKTNERFRDIERERKKEIKELIIRGQQPDWKNVSERTARDYADIKLKIELRVYVSKLIQEGYNSKLIPEEKKKRKVSSIKSWNQRTRFYLLRKIGALDAEFFKAHNLSQDARYSIVANLLECDPRNAKKYFNGEEQVTREEKEEVDDYLASLKIIKKG